MVIYIGADHRGFNLKEGLISYFKESGYEIIDCGNIEHNDQDDYVDFASEVARQVGKDASRRGIVLCGSGVGVSIVANKFPNIRCSLCFSADQAIAARHDDDANVIAIPADFILGDVAKKIISTWLQTDFDGGDAYVRRVQKISEVEYEVKESK
ncbi:MAG: RpiB/LacA/LacB family sugar-phosphate isomerase [Candidatus Paceibacterota bacterium]